MRFKEHGEDLLAPNSSPLVSMNSRNFYHCSSSWVKMCLREISITRQNTLCQERKDVGASSRGKSTLFIAYHILGFPDDSDGKESACNMGDSGLILWLGRSPGEGNGNPLQYSCLENPTGQRSLVGYSPWGCTE